MPCEDCGELWEDCDCSATSGTSTEVWSDGSDGETDDWSDEEGPDSDGSGDWTDPEILYE